MQFSRRTFLTAAGAATLGAALASAGSRAAAASADDFATIRSQWSALLTGGAVDTSDPAFAAAFAGLNANAASALATLNTAPGAAQLFTDLPIGTVSANVTSCFYRLEALALAYVTPGTKYTGDASVVQAVTSGLDFMVAGPYATGTKTYNNWWDWQVGSAQTLVDTATLVYDHLSAAQIASYCASLDRFLPDPTYQISTSNPSVHYTTTGANRLDMCRAVLIRGAIADDAAMVTKAVQDISDTLPLVSSGNDGLYADGSWIQHGNVAYSGTYGQIWFADVAKLLNILSGTAFQISDPNVANVFFAATNAFMPVVYNGLMTDAVRGRAVTRPTETDADDGWATAYGQLLLAPAAPAAVAATVRATVKGWLQRSPLPVSANGSIPQVALAQQLLSDSSVPAAPEPVGHRLYGAMDRAYHRRPGWAAVLSMASEYVAWYESGSENVHGWHTGDGMMYVYLDSDNRQFNDAFWPTVDPYRLPGTTASLIPLKNAQLGSYNPGNLFAGGATDGEFAVIGQDLQAIGSTLTAKKAWFCLDDAVVCLGAGISCTDGHEVDTVIENRNLHASGTNALTVNGQRQPAAQGWTQTFSNARWACLDGVAGYIFPRGQSVTARREQRTGAWGDVEGGADPTKITRNYLTLYVDHGTAPSDAGYVYILLPGAAPDAVAERAADQGYANVLVNTAAQQGIAVPSQGVTAANFYAPGKAGPVTASAPCSVLVREHAGGTATIAVSDPTLTATSLTVTWQRPVKKVLGGPSTLAGSTAGGSLSLKFGDLTGATGDSQKVTVALG